MTAPADTAADLLRWHRQMLVIRHYEETVQKLFLRGLIPGTTHLAQGQEAIPVGFAAESGADDYWTYTYRGHGHVLARGMAAEPAFAEMMGRRSGVNAGKGGSMHLTDKNLGLMGSFAIVGAGLPVAVGLGRSAQLRRSGQVSITFFGDGSTNIGAFHESMNLAAVWGAPVVFVCENNLYGEYTRIDRTTPVSDLAERAASYAMRARIVDGNDVEAVRAVAREVIELARAGLGPTFVECKTYRQRGHSRTDAAKYRPQEEVAQWLLRDPLLGSRRRLLETGAASAAELDSLEEEVITEVSEAAERAANADWPGAEEMTTDVYA